jgi:hypothetical protein
MELAAVLVPEVGIAPVGGGGREGGQGDDAQGGEGEFLHCGSREYGSEYGTLVVVVNIEL